MKKILLIYTGGTIGMVKDKKKNTLVPLDFDILLKTIPELKSSEIDLNSISTKKPINSKKVGSKKVGVSFISFLYMGII